jgi:transposase
MRILTLIVALHFIKLANGHLAKDIDALMPWAYAPTAITSQ